MIRCTVTNGSRLTVAMAAMLLMAGCTVKMPDGSRMGLGTSPAVVHRTLGEPDLQTSGIYGIWGSFPATREYFLDRGWVLVFQHGTGLWSARELGGSEIDDLRRQAQVMRETVPTVAVGTSSLDLLKQLGPPSVVYDIRGVNGSEVYYQQHYKDQLETTPAAKQLLCYFPSRDISVVLREGRVAEVKPISDFERGTWAKPDSERMEAPHP